MGTSRGGNTEQRYPQVMHRLSTTYKSYPQDIQPLSTVCTQFIHNGAVTYAQAIHRLYTVCAEVVHRVYTEDIRAENFTENGTETAI